MSEPVLVENEMGSYLLTVVYESDMNKSLIYALEATSLKDFYVTELLEAVLPSFNDRWG